MTGSDRSEATTPSPVTPRRLVLYFLRLGLLGFGGPVALANAMRRDLVEREGWISEEEYERGLALAAACPGPLAFQLAVYCGYIRFGIGGGLSVAIAFASPPFLLVTFAASLYVRWSESETLLALFRGIGPIIVALIVRSCWMLGKRTLRRDGMAWLFALAGFVVTVVIEREVALTFVLAGILGALLFAPRRDDCAPKEPSETTARSALLVPFGSSVLSMPSVKLFLFFFKTGLLVFGSGLVIVPFLKAQVVDQYHWLSDRQFFDAVAIGMILPGPVVITATFVGYLLDGFHGALAATLGIFSPPVLFTLLATPLVLRHHRNPLLVGFIRGISATVVGVLAGTTLLIGRGAITDLTTAVIALCAMLALLLIKKLPEPLLILAGAVVGWMSTRF